METKKNPQVKYKYGPFFNKCDFENYYLKMYKISFIQSKLK